MTHFFFSIKFTTCFSSQFTLCPKEALVEERREAIINIFSDLISRQTSPAKDSKETIRAKFTLSFPMDAVTEKIKTIQWIQLFRKDLVNPDLYIKMITPAFEKSYYPVKLNEGWEQTLGLSLRDMLFSSFGGNQIEMKARPGNKMFQKKSAEFWNGGVWRTNPDVSNTYYNIESRIEQLLSMILDTPFENGGVPRNEKGIINLLEFFGGKGNCAERMMSLYGQRLNYVLTDLDEQSVQLARQNLDSAICVLQFDAIKDDLAIFEPHHPFGVVLASGGTTWEVLESKEEAIIVLKRMFEMVAPGGILVLTGLQRQWVSDKELEELLKGTMLNRYDIDLEREFYIIQKPVS